MNKKTLFHKKIAVLPGDGIGPEVTDEAIKVLKAIAKKYGFALSFEYGSIGAVAIDQYGKPLPEKTLDLCENSDSILFGAIGHPKYDNNPKLTIRPEQGLLALRQKLELYGNVRPIFNFKGISGGSPLKDELTEGVDFVIIRELTGGLYFGSPRGRSEDGSTAYDTCVYTKAEVERVTTIAFEMALKRNQHVTLVDKANVLATSRLWRETVTAMAKHYPKIKLDFMFVDNAAMQIIKFPKFFDVILTENLFGDILSDEASVITGSLGMLPSASIGIKTNLFEPIHGSYPQAAGKNIANPIAAILSAAMLLEYSFGLFKEAKAIRKAVETTIQEGFGTEDLNPKYLLSTTMMGDKITKKILA